MYSMYFRGSLIAGMKCKRVHPDSALLQAYVVSRWEVLQDKVTTRRSELIMAYDLQRLLAECKVRRVTA